MSSSLQQLQAKPALFAAVAVAAGAGATLLATHLTNAWCPVAGQCSETADTAAHNATRSQRRAHRMHTAR
jgi:hypothetical protein